MLEFTELEKLASLDRAHHLHPITNPVLLSEQGPTMISKAEGVYIYTSEGRKIMDIGSGVANVNIGYANERLCKMAYQTMKQLSFAHTQNGRSNPWVAELSEKLNELTSENYQQFFFASTGSEAVESAVKMALYYWQVKKQPKKRAVIARHHSYHGNTMLAGSLTGIPFFHSQFGLPLEGIYLADAPYWYRYGKGRSKEQFGLDVANSLEAMITDIGAENIAAFIGDPVQTGGGTIIPPNTYWPEVRRICDEYDILLIADEVISGFGKTGQLFGFQNFSYEPDMFVMAKGMSSGYFPISSVALSDKVCNILQQRNEVFAHVFTNCGHPVGCAVALENIAIIEEEKLTQKVRDDIGPYFSRRLQELLEFPCVGEVRSLGVLGAIEFDLEKIGAASQISNAAFNERFIDIAWQKGVAFRGGGLALPMIITQAQLDDAIEILKDSLQEALNLFL